MNKKISIIFLISFIGLIIILGTILFYAVNKNSLGNNNPINILPVGQCKIGGCSSQLCLEPGDEGVSTCEYTESYACYQTAKCERQQTGRCEWTQSEGLKLCLAKSL